MKQKTLFALWGVLFALCAGLGFIPEPTGFVRFLLVVLALVFFIPPALILRRAQRRQQRQAAALVRNLAAASLIVTLILLVGNVLTLLTSEAVGRLLYAMLVVASAPMVCGQYNALSMFCWACLLFAGNHILKTMKTRT